MSRLDRLILNEILSPFMGSALLFTGLFFAGGELVRYAEFLQRGQGILLVVRLVLYTFPQVIALTFPMALLLATLLGFGRLSAESEITALTASGVSFTRIMAPVAVFGLVISLLGYWINDSVVPETSRQKEAMVKVARRNGVIDLSSANAIALTRRDDDNGTTTHIFAMGGVEMAPDGDTATLRGVSVEYWQHGALALIVTAPVARWVINTTNWDMEDATSIHLGGPGQGRQVLSGDKLRVTIGTPQSLSALQDPVEQVTTAGLRARVAALRSGGNASQIREAEVEIARRAALPFASLVFALIGAPLGVRSTRGGKGVGFGLSVVITFCYWLAVQIVSVLARGGFLPPFLALMLPNVICLGVAWQRIRQVGISLGR